MSRITERHISHHPARASLVSPATKDEILDTTLSIRTFLPTLPSTPSTSASALKDIYASHDKIAARLENLHIVIAKTKAKSYKSFARFQKMSEEALALLEDFNVDGVCTFRGRNCSFRAAYRKVLFDMCEDVLSGLTPLYEPPCEFLVKFCTNLICSDDKVIARLGGTLYRAAGDVHIQLQHYNYELWKAVSVHQAHVAAVAGMTDDVVRLEKAMGPFLEARRRDLCGKDLSLSDRMGTLTGKLAMLPKLETDEQLIYERREQEAIDFVLKKPSKGNSERGPSRLKSVVRKVRGSVVRV